MLFRKLLSVSVVCLFCLPALWAKTKVQVVDCGKGESINAALASSDEALIIEIHGMCTEDVVINRDHVALRGTDPAADGIAAANMGLSPDYRSALLIRGARFVTVENLTIEGAEADGIIILNSLSEIVIRNCQVQGNGGFGLYSQYSEFSVQGTTFAGNGVGGLTLLDHSRLRCNDCVVEANPSPGEGWALDVNVSSRAFLLNSQFKGEYGVDAINSSEAMLTDTLVKGRTLGLWSRDHSRIFMVRQSLDGSFLVVNKSLLSLEGVDQSALSLDVNSNPVKNRVEGDSYLSTDCANCGTANPIGTALKETKLADQSFLGANDTILETTTLDSFSNGVIKGESEGEVYCASGGEIFCEYPMSVLSDCASCLSCPGLDQFEPNDSTSDAHSLGPFSDTDSSWYELDATLFPTANDSIDWYTLSVVDFFLGGYLPALQLDLTLPENTQAYVYWQCVNNPSQKGGGPIGEPTYQLIPGCTGSIIGSFDVRIAVRALGSRCGEYTIRWSTNLD